MKIYVASSWRNSYQPAVVELLKRGGDYEVYDFKNPEPGNDGFRWSAIDPNWKDWDTKRYAKALEHPIAQKGFKLDMSALTEADICVLVLPSGRSASFEYGYHCGVKGRPGIVYMPENCEPELMYSGSVFAATTDELLRAVEAAALQILEERKRPSAVGAYQPGGENI
jgi:hypothetical protein